MPNKATLWIKTMAIRTRNRTVNLPTALRGMLFHGRVALTPKRGPRIFIQRWGGIGDIVCLEPSLRALRDRHPDAFIVFSTQPEYLPLARMIAGVDVALDARGADYYRVLTDHLYDVAAHPRYQDERPTGLTHIHIIDDLARFLDVTLTDRQPRLTVPPKLRERLRPQVEALRRGGGPIIAIQPGPSEPVRTWPHTHWEELTRRLTTELGATVIHLGADFHNLSGAEVKVPRVSGAEDWVNRLDIVETAAMLSLCDGFIGIDSGLLHIAGAVGTPSVGLFGPVDPAMRLAPTAPAVAVRAPRSLVPCLGCHHLEPPIHWRKGCPYDVLCMRILSPDAAFDAARALLLPDASDVRGPEARTPAPEGLETDVLEGGVRA